MPRTRMGESVLLLLVLAIAQSGLSYAETSLQSEPVTGLCTSSPCPWGSSISSQAVVWPEDLGPVAQRLGYTLSHGVYLPAENANGLMLRVETGTATAFAGLPSSNSHRVLRTLGAGQSYEVTGLVQGEVLSVYSPTEFVYNYTVGADVQDGPEWVASNYVTGSCTGSPCPWGSAISGQAVVWPEELQPLFNRLGYTVSKGIYLPAASASGLTLRVQSGTATVFAGLPSSSTHRVLSTLIAGQSYQVTALAQGEVLSVQALTSGLFFYDFLGGLPPQTSPDWNLSTFVTGSCTGSPCPWGSSISGEAVEWPEELLPLAKRLGYTLSTGAYLPAASANGLTIRVHSGQATAFAGLPDSTTHRVLRTVIAGDSYTVSGLTYGEVFSVQAPSRFHYDFTPVDPITPPSAGDVFTLLDAVWKCNWEGCAAPDWTGAVVSWPSWSAYQSNGRSGENSRSTYSVSGDPLYPYTGSWINGCAISVLSGDILVIEWERGTEYWRETWLWPGESYVIDLMAPQDSVIIEGVPGSRIAIDNCDPQPLL